MATKKYGKPPSIFKLDISATKYALLLKHFSEEDKKESTYFYLDAALSREGAKLFNSRIRLRVRLRGKKYSFELKDKGVEPRQDLSHKITRLEFENLLEGKIPKGIINDYLFDRKLLCSVNLVRTFYVIRSKRDFYGGILVLEKTRSVGQESYQIEFRSNEDTSSAIIKQIKGRLRILSKKCEFVPKIDLIFRPQRQEVMV